MRREFGLDYDEMALRGTLDPWKLGSLAVGYPWTLY